MTDTVAPDRPSAPSRLWSFATTVAVTLTLLLATAATCDGAEDPSVPSVGELLERSTIYRKTKLRIGVTEGVPLMGYLDKDGTRKGFDIDIARFIAKSLGYDTDAKIDFVAVDTEDRELVLKQDRVDLVVASFSITDERKKDVAFAGPYLVTSQEVLIPNELVGQIATIGDLKNPEYKVCATGGSTTWQVLRDNGIEVETSRTHVECLDGILDGRYHAMSSDATILAGLYSQQPTRVRIVDMPFGGDESLGVGVPIDDPALRDLVSFFLNRSYEDAQAGRATAWQAAYNNNLGPWLGGDGHQPRPLDVPELIDHDSKAPPT